MAAKIGIPVPTRGDPTYNAACWPQYAAAVERAGGRAISLSLTDPTLLEAELKGLDGFVLPGSPADVSPSSYGQARHAATAASDPAREACDRSLLAHAAATGKPLLAICFGLQLLNVWRGGTLAQDLLPIPVNHAAGSRVAVAHSVQVERESLFAGLLSATEAPPDGVFRRLPVNSSHHQAVQDIGDDLVGVARSAEDGVIEALEGRIGASVMLGVQWHPERSTELSAASRALFTWLVSEAEDRKSSTTLEGEVAGRC